MFKALTIAALLVVISPAFGDDGSKTWEGTWNNKKYGTSGPLKCVATQGKDGKWTAKFSGTFMNDPFSYDVSFDSKNGKGQSDLSGKAELGNHKYDWTGSLKGDTLRGTYKSNSGYYGDFVLKEKK